MTRGEKVLKCAMKDLGLTEYPANSNNVKFNTWYYGHAVSGAAYPWCMAAVQFWYDEAGYALPYKTASCGALLNWYKQNQPECVVKTPVKGCLVIFDLPNTKAVTDHVGLFESATGDYVTTIDGNTGSASDANGGAVMRRTRPKKYVYAYIKPRGLDIDDDAEAAKQAAEQAKQEGENMTGEQIYDKLTEYLAKQSAPDWAKAELAEAVKLGITDGTAPMALIPRYQAAIMALRAVKRT